MISIKVKNEERFKAQLRGNAGPALVSKIQTEVKKKLVLAIPELFITQIKQTPTFLGLSGQYAGDTTGRNLQAEFGLSSTDANKILDDMMTILRSAIKVAKTSETANLIRITLLPEKLEELKTIPGASYYSYSVNSPTAYEIPWMDWVLDGNGRIDGARIAYGPDFKSSRSGFAIMLETSNVNAAQWIYATDDKPNFIFKTFSSALFLKSINNLYAQYLAEVLVSRKINV